MEQNARGKAYGEEPFERQHVDDFAKSSIRLLEQCGKLSTLTALGDGKPEKVSVLMKGHRDIQQLVFSYRAQTPRGIKRFDVTVQAAENGDYRVSGVGCGRQ